MKDKRKLIKYYCVAKKLVSLLAVFVARFVNAMQEAKYRISYVHEANIATDFS